MLPVLLGCHDLLPLLVLLQLILPSVEDIRVEFVLELFSTSEERIIIITAAYDKAHPKNRL